MSPFIFFLWKWAIEATYPGYLRSLYGEEEGKWVETEEFPAEAFAANERVAIVPRWRFKPGETCGVEAVLFDPKNPYWRNVDTGEFVPGELYELNPQYTLSVTFTIRDARNNVVERGVFKWDNPLAEKIVREGSLPWNRKYSSDEEDYDE